MTHDELFSRKSIHAALKAWRDSKKLGEHPLTQLRVVQERVRGSGGAAAGIALRQVLREAIEGLKPDGEQPELLPKRWRSYFILHQRFVSSRSKLYIEGALAISPTTYYSEQRKAFDGLADRLRLLEEGQEEGKALVPQREEASALRVPEVRVEVPFLAPPRPDYELVGRKALLAQLKAQLLQEGHQLLSALHGLPGVGKTALAIELAYSRELLNYFKDGILWVGLGREADVLALLGLWSKALGISAQELSDLTTVRERVQALHAAIGLRRMLLVIDDAWQVETALAFKIGGPNCAYLLTTRLPNVALDFAGDGVITVNELDEADGLRLLAHFCAASGDDARTLVQAVGGLPLALTLMGRYLRKASRTGQPRRLRAALARLRQAEERLRLAQPRSPLVQQSSLGRSSSERQAQEALPLSLQAVIGISHQALQQPARDALRRLALFPSKPNTFSEAAALAVSDTSTDALDMLTDAGLLECSGLERYALHQAIADYARLEQTNQPTVARFVSFFRDYLEAHQRDYEIIEVEVNNILAAHQQADAYAADEALVQSTNLFYCFLEVRGLYELAFNLLTRAKEAAEKINDPSALVITLLNLGKTLTKQGDYAQAEADLQAGLTLAREMAGDAEAEIRPNRKSNTAKNTPLNPLSRGESDWNSPLERGFRGVSAVISRLLLNLGIVARKRGHYQEAEGYFAEGLALARALGNDAIISHLLQNLGAVSFHRGDYAQAEDYYQEGLILARKLQHRERISALLLNLGGIAVRRGEHEQAEAYFEEGLTLARALGYRERICILLVNLGAVAFNRGLYAQAESHFQEGLTIAQAIEHRELISALLVNLGEVASHRKQYQQAEGYFQEALPLARTLGHRQLIANLLLNLATVAHKRGNDQQAHLSYQEALSLARTLGHRWLISGTLVQWGQLHLKQKNYSLASSTFHEALQIAQEVGIQELIAKANYGLAQVALAQGEQKAARKQAQDALVIFETIHHAEAEEVRRWLAKVGTLLALNRCRVSQSLPRS